MNNLLSLAIGLLCLIPGVGSIQVIPLGIALGLNLPLVILSCEFINTIPECLAPHLAGSSHLVSFYSQRPASLLTKKAIYLLLGLGFGLLLNSFIGSWNISQLLVVGVAVAIISTIQNKKKAVIYLVLIGLENIICKESMSPVGVIILSLSLFASPAKALADPVPLVGELPICLLSNGFSLWLPGISANSFIYALSNNPVNASQTVLLSSALAEGISVGLSQKLTFSGKSMMGSMVNTPIDITLILCGLFILVLSCQLVIRFLPRRAYLNPLSNILGKAIVAMTLAYFTPYYWAIIGISFILHKLNVDEQTRSLTFISLVI